MGRHRRRVDKQAAVVRRSAAVCCKNSVVQWCAVCWPDAEFPEEVGRAGAGRDVDCLALACVICSCPFVRCTVTLIPPPNWLPSPPPDFQQYLSWNFLLT